MIEAVIEVVAAAGAQRRDLALVVAVGETEIVLLQGRMVEFRLRDIGHFGSAFCALVCDSPYYLIRPPNAYS